VYTVQCSKESTDSVQCHNHTVQRDTQVQCTRGKGQKENTRGTVNTEGTTITEGKGVKKGEGGHKGEG